MFRSGTVASYGSSIFSFFKGSPYCFFTMAISIFSPTNNVGGFPFLYTLSIIDCLYIFWWCPFWLVWGDTEAWIHISLFLFFIFHISLIVMLGIFSCLLRHYLQWSGHRSNLNVIDRWKDKEDVAHIYNGILLSHIKRNKIVSFVDMWMDLEIVVQSEVS